MAEESRLRKSIRDLQATFEETGQRISTVTHAIKELGGSMLGFIQSTISMAPKFEEIGAKFSQSFNDASQIQALAISEFTGADVWKSFAFNLQSNRLGLDANSQQLQNLFAITQVTGEDMVTLQKGLLAATVGQTKAGKSRSELINAVEVNSRAFNLSREELVAALGALSADTKNLIAATGNQSSALGQTAVQLQALIPDQRLFGEAMNQLNRQFTMGGMVEAMATGFPIDEILNGQAKSTDVLKAIINQGVQAQNMLVGNGRQLIFQNAALKPVFGDLTSKIGVLQGIQQRVADLTGENIESIKKLSTDELVTKLDVESKKRAKENQQFIGTMQFIKNQILRPLINRASSFFLSLRETLGDKNMVKMLQNILVGIGETLFYIGKLILTGIGHIADFFGDTDISSTMGKTLRTMDDIKSDITRIAKSSSTVANIATKQNSTQTQDDKLAKALSKQSVFTINQSKMMISSFKNTQKILSTIAKNTGKQPAAQTINLSTPQNSPNANLGFQGGK